MFSIALCWGELEQVDVKEQLSLERSLRVRGIESVEMQTNLFQIAEIAAALARVRSGVLTPLLLASLPDLSLQAEQTTIMIS